MSARVSFDAAAAQHGEPRAGDPRAGLEVEDAERLAELPVRLRRERERRLVAPRVEHRVVGLARRRRARSRAARSGSRAAAARSRARACASSASPSLICVDERLQLVARRRELRRLLVELRHPLVRRVALLAQPSSSPCSLRRCSSSALPRVHDRGDVAAAAQHVVHSGWVEHRLSLIMTGGWNADPTVRLTSLARPGSESIVDSAALAALLADPAVR